MEISSNILDSLKHEPLRKKLIAHPLLIQLKSDNLSFEQVTVILAQWYHPLHFFPTFLASLIAIAPSLSIKTHISKILWQELGEGNVLKAHEYLYEETMLKVGFKKEQFIEVTPLETTVNLVDGYKASTANNYLTALGYAFSTEAADLAMVSSIGCAVKLLTGAKNLEWVDIHVKQEPDHVDCVSEAVASQLSKNESFQIIESAKAMWQYWIAFFDGLRLAINCT